MLCRSPTWVLTSSYLPGVRVVLCRSMSNTSINIASNGFQSQGQQPRRIACDRCRAQKLRCLYNDLKQEACERCLRAKSKCIHSPPLRLGRRPQSNKRKAPHGGRDVVRKRGPTNTRLGRSHPTSPDSAESIADYDADEQEPPDNQLEPVVASESFSLRSRGYGGDEDGDSHIQHSQPKPQSETTQNIENPINDTTGHTKRTSDLFQFCSFNPRYAPGNDHEVGLASPVLVSNTPDIGRQLFFDDLSIFDFPSLEDPLHLASFMLSPTHYPPPGLNDFQEVVPDTTSSNADVGTHGQHQVAVLSSANSRTEASTAVSTGPPLSAKEEISAHAPEIQCPIGEVIRRLSDLNLGLHKIAATMATLHPSPTSSNSSQATPTKPASEVTPTYVSTPSFQEIMSNSQDFLDILKLFLPSQSPHQSHSSTSSSLQPGFRSQFPLGTSKDNRESRLSTNSYSTRPVDAGHEEAFVSTHQSSFPSSATARTVLAPCSLLQPDSPTILIVISCYVCLLRIYSDLFAIFDSSMRSSISTSSDIKLPLTGVQLSGLQIQGSGVLQIVILVQVSVHVLDRIERALGIPLGHDPQRTSPWQDPRNTADISGHSAVNQGGCHHGDCQACTLTNSSTETIGLGILRRWGSLNILELAVKSEDQASLDAGRRRIGNLRQDLKELNALLKET